MNALKSFARTQRVKKAHRICVNIKKHYLCSHTCGMFSDLWVTYCHLAQILWETHALETHLQLLFCNCTTAFTPLLEFVLAVRARNQKLIPCKMKVYYRMPPLSLTENTKPVTTQLSIQFFSPTWSCVSLTWPTTSKWEKSIQIWGSRGKFFFFSDWLAVLSKFVAILSMFVVILSMFVHRNLNELPADFYKVAYICEGCLRRKTLLKGGRKPAVSSNSHWSHRTKNF